MVNELETRLLKFLDSEFVRQSRNPRPRVTFRAKDVIAGSLTIRQPSLLLPKSRQGTTRGMHIMMGKYLTTIVENGGNIGGYLIRRSPLNPARGTRFIATRNGDDAYGYFEVSQRC